MNLFSLHLRSCLVVPFLIFSAQCLLAADPFPTQALPGTGIGGNLSGSYEPSGAVWHSGISKLLTVSDGGTVTSMNSDGTGVSNWWIPGDLEGITVADPNSPFVYVGVEHPDSILEFNIDTGLVTRSFDLTPWLTGSSNRGLEALTFLPDPLDSEGGQFYAGLQSNGKIYSFQLPILSSSTSTTVTPLSTITPVAGRNDISGLDYDVENEVLYAIFDNFNALRAMQPDGTFLSEWELPKDDQEGIAITTDNLFIAEDSADIEIWRYSPFPFLLAADFDNDNDVDSADIVKWESDYGLNADSDANNDGDSAGADFLFWQRIFGIGTTLTATVVVPEPASWLLWLMGIMFAPSGAKRG